MAAAIIETPRLILRGWTDDDLEPWCAMNADPRVTEFFPVPFPRERSLALAAAMREELEHRGYGWWIAEVKDSSAGKFDGTIALTKIAFQAHFTPAVEIGWRLPFALWGNGYATEGARAALDFGFNRLQLDEIVAITAVPNGRSQRVMQKLGMTRDPRDDFDHPKIEPGHRLARHVLYRMRAPQAH